ncbi:serine/threonine protein kinase [Chloroflexota bacterium]
MWGINEAIIIMVLIYTALAVNVVILLSTRNRKRSRSRSGQGKTQVRNSAGDNTYIVNGRYELRVPPHKQGGMATIWLAIERKTGKECIIKTPRRGTTMDNVYLDKLMLEASYLKKLKHSSIVKYLDDFYYKGEFHLVIEYLNGETLMAASPRSQFKEQQVIAWGCQLLDALSYLHSAGIVHRDVNPKNIMLCSNDAVKLIDFGTAKNLNDAAKDKANRDPFTQITNKGFDIPELFIGGDIDQRCDLCGLAQTCIYLLTLKHPNEICRNLFKSNWPRSYSEATAVANYLISSGISKRAAKCLAQAILFSPDNRFADAGAFKAALSSADGYPMKPVEVLSKK